MTENEKLSRREREIMEIIFSIGTATATEVMESLLDAPCNAAVRRHLRILEEKKLLTHSVDGKRFVYRPVKSKKRVAKSALGKLLKVYFGNSLQKAVAAHLSDPEADLSEDELNELEDLIKNAKEKGAKND